MAPRSKTQFPLADQAELTAAICRLADLVELLTTAVEHLATEIQWQNNERSQDYGSPHLPLTRLPRDPATRDWHPRFGDGDHSPIPRDSGTTPKAKPSSLFD